MYRKESIKKVVSSLKNAIKHYMGFKADAIKLCISKGNVKIGRVMNVSLAPILTCANCKECKYFCYDIKANLQYKNVVDARARNTALLYQDRDLYFETIDKAISRRLKNKYFRWHVSGDIVDYDYFVRMVEIARKHPDFVFWTYTKNYSVVNMFLDVDTLPENLHVMFSEWRGLTMDNPHNMPEFRVVFKSDPIKPTGFYCMGNCDICKALKRGCIVGETTYCNEH